MDSFYRYMALLAIAKRLITLENELHLIASLLRVTGDAERFDRLLVVGENKAMERVALEYRYERLSMVRTSLVASYFEPEIITLKSKI